MCAGCNHAVHFRPLSHIVAGTMRLSVYFPTTDQAMLLCLQIGMRCRGFPPPPPLPWRSTWIPLYNKCSQALAATRRKCLHQIVAASNVGCFVTSNGPAIEALFLSCKKCAQMDWPPSFTRFWKICVEKVLLLFCLLPRVWRSCLQCQDEGPCFCFLRLLVCPFSLLPFTLHGIILPGTLFYHSVVRQMFAYWVFICLHASRLFIWAWLICCSLFDNRSQGDY